MSNRITIEALISSVVAKLRAKRTAAITSVTASGNEYTLNTVNTCLLYTSDAADE